MKFDVLVESFLTEGRLKKSEKYASSVLSFDEDKFKDMLQTDALAPDIERNITHTKLFGGLPKETVDKLLNKISDEFSGNPPSTYEDFKDRIYSTIDDAFIERGPRRAIFVGRLATRINNLIFNSGAVSVSSEAEEGDIGNDEIEDEINGTETSEISSEGSITDQEEKIVNYIENSDKETSREELISFVSHTFAKEEDEAAHIVDSLISSGVLRQEHNVITVAGQSQEQSEEPSEEELRDIEAGKDENESFSNEEAEEDDRREKRRREREDLLSADREVADIFNRTLGSDRDYFSSSYGFED